MSTGTRSRIPAALVTLTVAGVVVLAANYINPSKGRPGPGPSIAQLDKKPQPSPTLPSPTPKPKGTQRPILQYVVGWAADPPTIHYTVSGEVRLQLPQEQGPWQWQSYPIAVIPGSTYQVNAGGIGGHSGRIFCQIVVDGIIVTPDTQRFTDQDPGPIRCTYTAPAK